MSASALVSLIALVFCLQVAMVFALVYVRVTRRSVDFLFALFAFSLGALCWAAMEEAIARESVVALFYLRMQYATAFVATALFSHFVWIAVKESVHPVILSLTYSLGVVCAGLSLTNLFLRFPAGHLPMQAANARGPLFPLLAGVLILCAAAAWANLLRGLKLSRDTAFAPITSNLPSVLIGGGAVLIVGGMIVVVVLFFPGLRLPVNPLPLAVMLFCLLIGSSLGREVVRGETEKRRLSENVRFREQTIRDLAHEIKNPLSGIEKAVTAVGRGLHRGVEATSLIELLNMSADSCRRLTRLMNNMLDTARLEAGRELELRREATDLRELAESAIEPHRASAPRHQFSLLSQLSCSSIRTDGDKVYQVLSNLIHNAVKYSPEGGQVTVRLWDETDEVRVSVTDEGVGMTPEQQERLFQPFERVVDPNRKIVGTGIGLHLVKQLVEAHGGRISVESEYGSGTTFTVSLPREMVDP